MLRTFFSGCFIALAMASSSYAYEMRTWTALNGKQHEAAYVRYEAPNVVVQDRDGRIIKVKRDSLCDDDWLYVSQHDIDILLFEVKLGETKARICPDVTFKWYRDGYDYQAIGTTEKDPIFKKIKSASSQFGKPLEFYCSTKKQITVKYDNTVIARFPMPPNSDTIFKLPKVHGGYSVYRKDGQLIESSYGDRYMKLIKVQGSDRNANDVFYIIEIALDPSVDNIKGFVEEHNQRIVHFVLNQHEGNQFAMMEQTAKNLNAVFRTIPRYARLDDKIRNQQLGVPTTRSTASGSPSNLNRTFIGSGSGFFISNNGFFLTNHHVIEGGSSIQLMTHEGIVPATVIRIDPAVDLALLQADSGNYHALPFLEKPNIDLGTDIFTIGFPMPDLQGFSPKMTKGVISSLKGLHDDDKEYQIDAAIQPGNSGGPVVDNNGQVVGVVVATLRAKFVAENKGVLPQNVNYAVKKKHVLDFLSQVPNALHEISTSNLPIIGISASPKVVEEVQKSCAMVIVYE